MVGLVDIAPAREKVLVGDQEVEVCGISAAGLAVLLQRFPQLRQLFAGREISMDDVFEFGGPCVAAIIAAGTGAPGNKDAEAVASQLTFDIQLDFIEAILKATLPGGMGNFMQKLERMGGVLGGAAVPSVSAPDTKSQKQSK